MDDEEILTRAARAVAAEIRSEPGHPPPDALLAYHEETLDAKAREEVQEHLAACPDCARVIVDPSAVDVLVDIEILIRPDRPRRIFGLEGAAPVTMVPGKNAVARRHEYFTVGVVVVSPDRQRDLSVDRGVAVPVFGDVESALRAARPR